MNFRRGSWLFGISTVLALMVTACGGSDPTVMPPSGSTLIDRPTPSATSTPVADRLTAEEESYLESVRNAEELSNRVFSGLQVIFRTSFPTREAQLAALVEAGVGTPYQIKLDALTAIDPPGRFQEDHGIWVESTRDLARLDSEAAQAVQNDDVVKFVLINGQLREISTRGRLALSPVFCGSTATNPQAASNCVPAATVFEGEYEAQLNRLLREFLPQFESMMGSLSFPLSLRAEELEQVITSVASETQDRIQTSMSAVGSLTPSDEMIGDHERL